MEAGSWENGSRGTYSKAKVLAKIAWWKSFFRKKGWSESFILPSTFVIGTKTGSYVLLGMLSKHHVFLSSSDPHCRKKYGVLKGWFQSVTTNIEQLHKSNI